MTTRGVRCPFTEKASGLRRWFDGGLYTCVRLAAMWYFFLRVTTTTAAPPPNPDTPHPTTAAPLPPPRPYYSSFSSVSVRCRRAFSFKRRLTDTCVLGNLPKTGTGFVGIHGSLREIPEGDEKYGRWRSLFFYRSRMTGRTRHSRALVSVVAALFLLSGGLRTLASSGISLRLAQASVKSTLALGRFPKAMKNIVAGAPYFSIVRE